MRACFAADLVSFKARWYVGSDGSDPPSKSRYGIAPEIGAKFQNPCTGCATVRNPGNWCRPKMLTVSPCSGARQKLLQCSRQFDLDAAWRGE